MPDTMTRGLIMQKACSHPLKAGLLQLVSARFQVCFTPLNGVLFTFPSRYWFTIGHRLVFSLGGWAPLIQTGFHVSRPTWESAGPVLDFVYGARHPLWPVVPVPFHYPKSDALMAVPQPRRASPPVWANPCSLAATYGITVVFFSSGY